MAAFSSMVVDVGGTNTRIALAQGRAVRTDTIKTFTNREFDSLFKVIDAYGDPQVDRVCVDIAGPVKDGQGSLTNLSWTVTEDQLCAHTGAKKSLLINDMQAQGYALDEVDPRQTVDVFPGKPATDGTRLVVNVGTGFNASPVYRFADRPFVPENEAGHVALAVPRGLPAQLRPPNDFLSIEDILSGRGLVRVLEGLAPGYQGDPGSVFPTFQATPTEELHAALSFFVQVLGAVTGDLALTHLPRGGVFLVGGVALGAAPVLTQLGFQDAFRAKGRFTEFMDQFSVHVNLDPVAALKGCAVALDAQAAAD